MGLNNRTISRINAMKVLYIFELEHLNVEEIMESIKDIDDEEINLDDFSLSLINGVIENKKAIDEVISKSLVGYTIKRLSLVDLSIIRIATYEFMMNTPKQVVINEAIEITKIFSNLDDDKAKAFNNRLLENIAQNI